MSEQESASPMRLPDQEPDNLRPVFGDIIMSTVLHGPYPMLFVRGATEGEESDVMASPMVTTPDGTVSMRLSGTIRTKDIESIIGHIDRQQAANLAASILSIDGLPNQDRLRQLIEENP
ncbi:hypothetical protein BH10PAT4_BH10PAT4_1890 [soil metagenome]